MNAKLIAEALRALANAFETPDGVPEAPPAPGTAGAVAPLNNAPPATPVPRGRGRPPKAPAEAPAAPAPAPAAEDPFSTEAPAAPTATPDEVRTALTELKAATDQATALGVLKSAGGADNLSSLDKAKYGAVVAAAKAALPAAKPTEPEDPFETAAPAAAPVVVEAAPSIEDVKAACVAAGKRTAQDKVQAIVMAHGGTAPSSTGAPGPSLKALPVPQYAAVIAAVNALPTTK